VREGGGRVKVLVFDLGGVLVINDMFDELHKLLERPLIENELKAKWLKSPAVRAFELGKCSPEEFAQAMVDEFELRISAADFIAGFTGWPKGFYAGAADLLERLRQRYSLACLSNSNELHWGGFVTASFDRAYSSHLLGKIKPDLEVFEFVTEDLGCSPAEIAFFDDSPLNVEAASAFGWDSNLTVGYADLVEVLGRKYQGIDRV